MFDQVPSKTPVSWLHELCTRNNISPKYELLQVEGAVHEPIFQYRISLEYNSIPLDESGSGRSKKEAKHNAARAMLLAMKIKPSDLLGSSSDPSGIDMEELGIALESEMSGNPVGVLQELCMKLKYPPPTYDVHSEEGLPHERLFAISCRVGDQFEAIGKGKSKKLAKRMAAHLMAERLRSVPLETASAQVNDDDDDRIFDQVTALKEKNYKCIGKSSSKIEKIALQHFMYQHFKGDCIQSLQDENEKININEDPKGFLKKLEKECNFQTMIIRVEEVGKSGLHQCLVQTTLEPPSYSFGCGQDKKEAELNAILDLIDIFRVLTVQDEENIENII